jgi:hypothetical protein
VPGLVAAQPHGRGVPRLLELGELCNCCTHIHQKIPQIRGIRETLKTLASQNSLLDFTRHLAAQSGLPKTAAFSPKAPFPLTGKRINHH